MRRKRTARKSGKTTEFASAKSRALVAWSEAVLSSFSADLLTAHLAANAATLAQYSGSKATTVRASLQQSHEQAWTKEWKGGIEVGGNLTIASTVNASLYYILSATRSDWPYGLSPGGLARDSYEGHSFCKWSNVLADTACFYTKLIVAVMQGTQRHGCFRT